MNSSNFTTQLSPTKRPTNKKALITKKTWNTKTTTAKFSNASTLSFTKVSTATSTKKACPQGFIGGDCSIECGLVYFLQNIKIIGGIVSIPNR